MAGVGGGAVGSGGAAGAIRRLNRELKEINQNPSKFWTAEPANDDLFEWHFTLKGPAGSDFEEGIYHGRIVLPLNYPFAPPHIMLLTPNGRFETNKKICLSISNYHPELWQPAWGLRTMIEALRSFFPSPPEGALGALNYPSEVRKRIAKTETRQWRCPVCEKTNEELLPYCDEVEEKKPEEEAASKPAESTATPADAATTAAAVVNKENVDVNTTVPACANSAENNTTTSSATAPAVLDNAAPPAAPPVAGQTSGAEQFTLPSPSSVVPLPREVVGSSVASPATSTGGSPTVADGGATPSAPLGTAQLTFVDASKGNVVHADEFQTSTQVTTAGAGEVQQVNLVAASNCARTSEDQKHMPSASDPLGCGTGEEKGKPSGDEAPSTTSWSSSGHDVDQQDSALRDFLLAGEQECVSNTKTSDQSLGGGGDVPSGATPTAAAVAGQVSASASGAAGASTTSTAGAAATGVVSKSATAGTTSTTTATAASSQQSSSSVEATTVLVSEVKKNRSGEGGDATSAASTSAAAAVSSSSIFPVPASMRKNQRKPQEVRDDVDSLVRQQKEFTDNLAAAQAQHQESCCSSTTCSSKPSKASSSTSRKKKETGNILIELLPEASPVLTLDCISFVVAFVFCTLFFEYIRNPPGPLSDS